jgi:hypothetical protein
MARAVLLVLLGGCGFQVGFDADAGTVDAMRDDATDVDAAIDGPPTPTTCLEKWQANQVTFSPPALLPNVPTAGEQGDPSLTADELVLFFVWDGDQFVDQDIWAAERTSISDPFGDSGIKASISDLALEDSKLSVNGNGLIGVIASQRTGTEGGWDLFEGRRSASGNAAFESVSSSRLGAINDASSQLDPHISADGLRLYFAAGSPQQIWVATRQTIDSAFGTPTEVAGIDAGEANADPTLSPDETVLVFTSSRPATSALSNLWYATRPIGGTFGTPVLVPDVNSDAYDGDAHLSADGCRLYFASTRDVTSDLYMAVMQ